MTYKRTQIYLDPEEHRQLVLEAAERGISLAEHLRRIVGARAGEASVAYSARAWDGIVAIADTGSKDTVEQMDLEVAEALDEQNRRAAGRARRSRRA